jgi:Phospholipase_D-nuclease N-terminal
MTRRRNKKKSWSDLSPAQRSLTVIAGAIQISLLIAALADLRRRPADQVRGGKVMWAALSFVNFFGPLAYFKFGRSPGPGGAGSTSSSPR